MQATVEEETHKIAETRPPRLIPVAIPDDYLGAGVAAPYPAEYKGHLDSIMISNETILARTKTLAKLINEDYKGERECKVQFVWQCPL